jgi:ribose/xylose/arabinose/galactoside ABC-type transport system permease subunit
LNLSTTKFRETILLVFILVIGITVAFISPNFLTWTNITNILRASAVNGIISLGMMVVIITGNIDVSVGSGLVISGGLAIELVVKNISSYSFINPLLSFLVAIIVGILIGLINGFFVSYTKVPAIVVTLGMASVLRGLICIITRGQWVIGLPSWFTTFASKNIGGVYIGVIIWLLLIILTYLLLYHSNIGRQIFALGGNQTAAIRVGINRTKIYMYSFAYLGALVGIASVIFFSQTGMLDPMIGGGYELTIIAAVIIGGAAITGGYASIFGTILGVILLGLIDNALVLAHIPVYWQKLVTGLLILLAVATSQLQQNKKYKIKPSSTNNREIYLKN